MAATWQDRTSPDLWSIVDGKGQWDGDRFSFSEGYGLTGLDLIVPETIVALRVIGDITSDTTLNHGGGQFSFSMLPLDVKAFPGFTDHKRYWELIQYPAYVGAGRASGLWEGMNGVLARIQFGSYWGGFAIRRLEFLIDGIPATPPGQPAGKFWTNFNGQGVK